MRGKRWVKSRTGLSWTDIETMMRSISTFHSASVSVTISPHGIGAGGGLTTETIATFAVLPGSALPRGIGLSGQWPCAEHDTLEAHVYAGLYDLDSEIGKVYKNEELWK